MEEVKPTSVNPVIESPQENPPSVTIEAKVETEVKTYTMKNLYLLQKSVLPQILPSFVVL
jgi:hypothetical protein